MRVEKSLLKAAERLQVAGKLNRNAVEELYGRAMDGPGLTKTELDTLDKIRVKYEVTAPVTFARLRAKAVSLMDLRLAEAKRR
jgi:hypothetical protein